MSNIYTQGGTTPKKRLAMAKDKTGDSYTRVAKDTKSKPSITPTGQDTSLKLSLYSSKEKYPKKLSKKEREKKEREREKTPFEKIIGGLFKKKTVKKAKKGGRIGKSKSRRRITLRGWGKALRGY